VNWSDVAVTFCWPRLTAGGKEDAAEKATLCVCVNTWCEFEAEGSAFRGEPLGDPVPPALPVSLTSPAEAAV